MNELGRLEDLPAQYVADLRAQNLVPLWPSLRALLPPGQPRPATQATFWSYQALRPLLLRAGELTPMEKAERRVLVLANPGHGLDNMRASPAIYLGMQLLLPGERAPAHRHTPNAVRMIVEGKGAYTTVDGQQCAMERGDLILTPSGLWHEHGHDGKDPVVWLDVLDLPIVHYLEASYVLEGRRQSVAGDGGETAYARGGLVPAPGFQRVQKHHPVLRYPWADARAALQSIAAGQPDLVCVQMSYVNPETGADAQAILGLHVLMLRPGQTLELPLRSPACVFHLIEGAAQANIGTEVFTLAEADTCCAPGYCEVTLRNPSSSAPAFIFMADEGPLHRKLGVEQLR